MNDQQTHADALRALAERFSEGWHDGIKIDASDVMSLSAAADALERAERESEIFLAERDHARAHLDVAVRLLTSIHSLLYPAPVTTADGRTMVFRPSDPDPHEVLQALSDRIRALPDELAKLVPPNVF